MQGRVSFSWPVEKVCASGENGMDFCCVVIQESTRQRNVDLDKHSISRFFSNLKLFSVLKSVFKNSVTVLSPK